MHMYSGTLRRFCGEVGAAEEKLKCDYVFFARIERAQFQLFRQFRQNRARGNKYSRICTFALEKSPRIGYNNIVLINTGRTSLSDGNL